MDSLHGTKGASHEYLIIKLAIRIEIYHYPTPLNEIQSPSDSNHTWLAGMPTTEFSRVRTQLLVEVSWIKQFIRDIVTIIVPSRPLLLQSTSSGTTP